MVNSRINPRANRKGARKDREPPHIVASQLKTLIPVGTAIIIVAAVKYARVSTSRPTVNIWWLQTRKPRRPMESIA
jgi:cellobiose-specific phosphotransferase system component IIC